jgi:hypothetical protein
MYSLRPMMQEVVLGFGILLGPAVIVGFYVWLYLKAFQTLRADRK